MGRVLGDFSLVDILGYCKRSLSQDVEQQSLLSCVMFFNECWLPFLGYQERPMEGTPNSRYVRAGLGIQFVTNERSKLWFMLFSLDPYGEAELDVGHLDFSRDFIQKPRCLVVAITLGPG